MRVVLFCLACILFTYPAFSNAAPRQIGDWEYSFDNWSINNGLGGFSSTGVTSGNNSLRLYGGDSLVQEMALDMHYFPEQGYIQSFLENEVMTIDVTTIASDWLKNPDVERLDTSFILAIWAGDKSGANMLNYTFPDYAWSPTQADLTQTFAWNYKAQRDIISGWATGVGWVSLAIITEWTSFGPPGYGGVYYLDNALLTPEPATLALLGLGSLALLRKKK